MNITLDELETFMAVVDTGSMTAAAQLLDLTVSAASRTLGRLEEKLKTTLMRRTTRKMELTEEGRTFLQHARAIIDSVENAEELMVARRENPSGLLRINAASPFMLHVIAPLVQGYRVRYPHVHVELPTARSAASLSTKAALLLRGRPSFSFSGTLPISNVRIRPAPLIIRYC